MPHSQRSRPTALVAVFVVCGFLSAIQAQPQGAILHKPFAGAPDSLVKATEYDSIERFGQVINVVPTGSTQSARMMRETVVEIIEYRDLTSATLTTPEQTQQLQDDIAKLSGVIAKFPETKNTLSPELVRLQQAAEKLESGEVLLSGRWVPRSTMANTEPSEANEGTEEEIGDLTIAIEGGGQRTFKQAKILKVESDGLRIIHSSGTAKVHYTQLPQELRGRWTFEPSKEEPQMTRPPSPTIADSVSKDVASPEEEDMLYPIPLGFSEYTKDRREAKGLLVILDRMDRFYGASVLKKGKTYVLDSLAGQTFGIQQRTVDLFLIADVRGQSMALIQFQPTAFEGIGLGQGDRAKAIGTYLGDQQVEMLNGAVQTFPVFDLKMMTWTTRQGNTAVVKAGPVSP